MPNVNAIDLSILGTATAPGSPTLVDGIRNALSAAIAKGSLPSGFRLREIPLAAHFGCSTTPVREAIRRLEHDGLVTVYPRRGAEVVSPSAHDVGQLYEIREVLECHAVRKAAELRPAKGELTKVRSIVKLQQQQLSIPEAAVDDPSDAGFHREVTALAGNTMIADMVERTVRQIEAVRSRAGAMVKGENAKTCAAHAAIVAAIAKGDPDRAVSLMREHLGRAQQVIISAMQVAAEAEDTASRASV